MGMGKVYHRSKGERQIFIQPYVYAFCILTACGSSQCFVAVASIVACGHNSHNSNIQEKYKTILINRKKQLRKICN
jgi:hypothetical protein